jgi:hypothetical protein
LKKAALAAFWRGASLASESDEFEDSEGLEGTERSESDLESAIGADGAPEPEGDLEDWARGLAGGPLELAEGPVLPRMALRDAETSCSLRCAYTRYTEEAQMPSCLEAPSLRPALTEAVAVPARQDLELMGWCGGRPIAMRDSLVRFSIQDRLRGKPPMTKTGSSGSVRKGDLSLSRENSRSGQAGQFSMAG